MLVLKDTARHSIFESLLKGRKQYALKQNRRVIYQLRGNREIRKGEIKAFTDTMVIFNDTVIGLSQFDMIGFTTGEKILKTITGGCILSVGSLFAFSSVLMLVFGYMEGDIVFKLIGYILMPLALISTVTGFHMIKARKRIYFDAGWKAEIL